MPLIFKYNHSILSLINYVENFSAPIQVPTIADNSVGKIIRQLFVLIKNIFIIVDNSSNSFIVSEIKTTNSGECK